MAPDHHLRRLRLAAIVSHYWPVDGEDNEAVIESESAAGMPVGRYATVTKDDDHDYYVALYEELDQALAGVADEVLGERTWHPYALYDLHTGEQLAMQTTVKVSVVDDDRQKIGHELEDMMSSEVT